MKNKIVFVLQMKKGEESLNLQRSLASFEILDKRLKDQFEKCKKISFPSLKSRIYTTASLGPSNSIVQDEKRIKKLAVELDNYLQIVLVDQLLCESYPVQLFFNPKYKDSDYIGTNISSSIILEDVGTNIRKLVRTPLSFSKEKLMSIVNLGVKKPSVTSENEVDVYIDMFFMIGTELFDLKNQWLRRKSLSFLRQVILQQVKSGKIGSVVDSYVQGLISTIIKYFESDSWIVYMLDLYWPLPKREFVFPPEEKDETLSHRSKEVLFELIGGNNYLQVLLGRYNCVMGIQRLHEMIQHKKLNRMLLLGMLESLIKGIFEEDKRVY